jgi:hypothetical protein
MWDFEQIISFAQGFSRPPGTELAFVFSEWTAADGLALSTAYPAVFEDLPPTEDAPVNQADRVWVKLNGGEWQQVSSIPSVTHIGLGETGVLVSGIGSAMVIAGWTAKGIAAGYVIAPTATMDRIQSERTVGVPLIRVCACVDEETHALPPDEPLTSGQVAALSTWLNDHAISDALFAGLFGATWTQLSTWLQNNPRWLFVQEIHDRFT